MDVAVRREREEVDAALDNLFRLGEHLGLRNPEGGLADGDGEVIDFDAVELVDGHEVQLQQAEVRVFLQLAQDIVFEAAEREVRFREEVAAAARGVEQDIISDTM